MFDPKKFDTLLTLVSEGIPVKKACELVGVSKRVPINWCRSDRTGHRRDVWNAARQASQAATDKAWRKALARHARGIPVWRALMDEGLTVDFFGNREHNPEIQAAYKAAKDAYATRKTLNPHANAKIWHARYRQKTSADPRKRLWVKVQRAARYEAHKSGEDISDIMLRYGMVYEMGWRFVGIDYSIHDVTTEGD